MRTIVICSGGLDSVSLAHKVAAEHELAGLLSFDYGQRHVKEVEYAAACARRLGVPHKVVDICQIGAALSGSALTDDVAVPDGHYAEETMKITIVPNRNAMMPWPRRCMAGIISSTPTAAPALSPRFRRCRMRRWRAMPR